MGEVDMLKFGGMHAAAAFGVQKMRVGQNWLSDCEGWSLVGTKAG